MSVDVLIPAKNASWCLAECIDSIARQTLQPSTVWVGVDACTSTAHTAQTVQKMTDMNIRVVYFPNHSWPYRIKNSLAMLSTADKVATFDADDIMYSDHLEKMDSGSGPGTFMRANALCEMDGETVKWDRAHGVICIMRDEFVRLGGYDGWQIAGDTEAITRWQLCGWLMMTSKDPTMLVRKHSRSLTVAEKTGYKSDARRLARKEISERARKPRRLDSIAVAPFVELRWPQTVDGLRPEILTAIEPYREQYTDRDAVKVVGDILRHSEPSYEKNERAAYSRAERWYKKNRGAI